RLREDLAGAVRGPCAVHARLRARLAGAGTLGAGRTVVARARVAVAAAGVARRIGGAARIGAVAGAVAIVVETVGAVLGAGRHGAGARAPDAELAHTGAGLLAIRARPDATGVRVGGARIARARRPQVVARAAGLIGAGFAAVVGPTASASVRRRAA